MSEFRKPTGIVHWMDGNLNSLCGRNKARRTSGYEYVTCKSCIRVAKSRSKRDKYIAQGLEMRDRAWKTNRLGI